MNTNSKRIPLVWLMTLGMVLFTGGYYLGLMESRKELVTLAECISSYKNKKPKSVLGKISVRDKRNKNQSMFRSTPLDPNDIKAQNKVRGIREILLEFQNETDPVYKFSKLGEAMKVLTRDNLAETLGVFESIPFGFDSAQEYGMLLYAWSQFDPYGAIDYCKSRSSGIGSGFAVSGVLEGWTARDPVRAKAWVENPENAGMAKLYNFGLIKGWASQDLKGASEYVMNLEGGGRGW